MVLVAEDNPQTSLLLKTLLEKEGCNTETTGSIKLTVSLFAATSGDMHHPVLTLEGLYLPTNVVDFG